VCMFSMCLTTYYSIMLRCSDTVLRIDEHSIQYFITNIFIVVS
jgi:hypothetical protein